ncbi:protein FAM50 homolog [Terrapene carolina triunguis]|uniref:protein FAM50 homolog n=1 Tax=Terrapene triunguis TaxID=2587831 RepID=UPI000E77D5BB|nr:protein FAM50 homolog [Terrapene carolina triunguis]
MKKGNTMQQFLQKALEILRKDFSELRSAGVEQLMYIKEDLIIPHVSGWRGLPASSAHISLPPSCPRSSLPGQWSLLGVQPWHAQPLVTP